MEIAIEKTIYFADQPIVAEWSPRMQWLVLFLAARPSLL